MGVLAGAAKYIAFSAMARAQQYLPNGVPGRCWLRSDRRLFDTAPRSHVELVALLATKGRMRYFIDDRVLTLEPGALLWAHTDQSHFLLSETLDFEMWVLVFSPSILKPARLFPPKHASQLGHGPEARSITQEAAAELAAIAGTLRRADDPALVATGMRWWAARGWSAWREAHTTGGKRVHPSVRRAADLLRDDPDADLSRVAREAGLSLSRLSKVFRDQLGLGLAEFRTSRRLDRVDAAMSRPDPPQLLSAALDAGFGSYSQFYRSFTLRRGINPRQYYSDTSTGGTVAAHSDTAY